MVVLRVPPSLALVVVPVVIVLALPARLQVEGLRQSLFLNLVQDCMS